MKEAGGQRWGAALIEEAEIRGVLLKFRNLFFLFPPATQTAAESQTGACMRPVGGKSCETPKQCFECVSRSGNHLLCLSKSLPSSSPHHGLECHPHAVTPAGLTSAFPAASGPSGLQHQGHRAGSPTALQTTRAGSPGAPGLV